MRISLRSKIGTVACFNPRPARVPGDADVVGLHRSHHWRFQSAPGTSAGRCMSSLRLKLRLPVVSIRARHECRAMLSMIDSEPLRAQCFNPRPARVPGDAKAEYVLRA